MFNFGALIYALETFEHEFYTKSLTITRFNSDPLYLYDGWEVLAIDMPVPINNEIDYVVTD